MQGGIDRRHMYFNPLSFACTKSRIESIGGIWLGMPGKSLSWLGSMVRTLSVSHGWPHGLSPSPLGETTLSRAGRAVGGRSRGGIRRKRLCSPFPVLLCTGGNVAAIEIPVVSVSQLKVSDALHIRSCWARCHGPSDPPHLQQQVPMVPQESPPSTKYMGFNALFPSWIVSMDHLHPIHTSAPLAILLCLLRLDGSTQRMIHCNTALLLHCLDFTKKECY